MVEQGSAFGDVAPMDQGQTATKAQYRQARVVGRKTWKAATRFLRDVGTTILVVAAILWVLLKVPAPGSSPNAAPIERSVAASVGRALEPVTKPAGFDWRTSPGYSRRGGAQVTDIRDINRRRDGYTIKGRIAVDTGNRNWRSGWGNDYRGWNDNYRGYDAGRFTCRVSYGRVVDLDYSGIRGL